MGQPTLSGDRRLTATDSGKAKSRPVPNSSLRDTENVLLNVGVKSISITNHLCGVT